MSSQTNEELLILVDEEDNEIGYEEKVACHLGEGKLHRAFSIFVFNDRNELLLQMRSNEKMLWGGFWTNTCCSHPRKGESLEEAVHRRIMEEMGFDCELKEIFKLPYHANFKNIGSEKEIDHVFIGRYNGPIEPNPEEVADWKWISIEDLKKDIEENPDNYTPWFKIALNRVIDFVERI
jgi:isopentenyl-diphosphate delta-isomerase